MDRIGVRLPDALARHAVHLGALRRGLRPLEIDPTRTLDDLRLAKLREVAIGIRCAMGVTLATLDPADLIVFARTRLIFDLPFQGMRRLCDGRLIAEEQTLLREADRDWRSSWRHSNKLRAFGVMRLYRQAFELDPPLDADGIEDPLIFQRYIEYLLEPPYFVRPGDRERYYGHMCRVTAFLDGIITGPLPGALRSAAAQATIECYSIAPLLGDGLAVARLAEMRLDLVGKLARLSRLAKTPKAARADGACRRIGLLVRSLWPIRSNRVLLAAAESLRKTDSHVILISSDEALVYFHDVCFQRRLFAAVDEIVRLGGRPDALWETLATLDLDGVVIATDLGHADAGPLDLVLATVPLGRTRVALGLPTPSFAIPLATHGLTNCDMEQAMRSKTLSPEPILMNEPLIPRPGIVPNAPFPVIDADSVLPVDGYPLLITQIDEWQLCAEQAAFWQRLLGAVPEARLIVACEQTSRRKPVSYDIPVSSRLDLLVDEPSVRERIAVLPPLRCFSRQMQRLLEQADLYLEPLVFSANSLLADAVAAGCIPAMLGRPVEVRASQAKLLDVLGLGACVHESEATMTIALSKLLGSSKDINAAKTAVRTAWAAKGEGLSERLAAEFSAVLPALFAGRSGSRDQEPL